KLIATIYAQQPQITLDNAYMLMHYAAMVGVPDTTFLTEWLPHLIAQEQSLFTLSTHFFARDAKKFLQQWKDMQPLYGEPFWITFWSEQLWRAAHYCDLMAHKELVEAKKIGFRLPFSFMQ